MSSATMSSGRPDSATFSRTGSRSFIAEIFFSLDEDVRVLEHRLHAVLVGDEVRREVAAVELHALDHFELVVSAALGFLDRDHALVADALCMASAIMSPISASPLAEIVANLGDLPRKS